MPPCTLCLAGNCTATVTHARQLTTEGLLAACVRCRPEATMPTPGAREHQDYDRATRRSGKEPGGVRLRSQLRRLTIRPTGLGFWVLGSGFWFWIQGFGFGFWVSVLGFWVLGLGSRVLGWTKGGGREPEHSDRKLRRVSLSLRQATERDNRKCFAETSQAPSVPPCTLSLAGNCTATVTHATRFKKLKLDCYT